MKLNRLFYTALYQVTLPFNTVCNVKLNPRSLCSGTKHKFARELKSELN
jgi:hypothetical protein